MTFSRLAMEDDDRPFARTDRGARAFYCGAFDVVARFQESMRLRLRIEDSSRVAPRLSTPRCRLEYRRCWTRFARPRPIAHGQGSLEFDGGDLLSESPPPPPSVLIFCLSSAGAEARPVSRGSSRWRLFL